MIIKHLLAVLLFFSLLQNQVFADKTTEPNSWSGNVQLGYTGTGGNSEDNNISGKLNLCYKKGNWTHTYKLSALYSDSNANVTAERYVGDFEWLYGFEPKLFTFLKNDSFYDQFNAYDISTATAAGLGFRLLNLNDISWDIQAGPGYRYARINDAKTYEKNLIAYASSVLKWTISKTTNFQERLATDYGRNNTQTKSESALSLKIIGNLGMQLSYIITHNNTIPTGSSKTKKTDYQTDITLLFSF